MIPGDIILTAKKGGIFARITVWAQSLWSHQKSSYYHAMRYIGQIDGVPSCLSQEITAKVKPLVAWRGKRLKIWHNPVYSPAQRKALVKRSKAVKGRRYDWLGIVGQGCRFIPLVGKWLSSIVETPWTTYCSELVARTEHHVNPDFAYGNNQPNPQDIDHYCRGNGWQCAIIDLPEDIALCENVLHDLFTHGDFFNPA